MRTFVTKDRLIRGLRTRNGVTGYDMITEEFIKHKGKYMEITDQLASSMIGEKARFQIAVSLTKTGKEAADILGISHRTFYRREEEFCPPVS